MTLMCHPEAKPKDLANEKKILRFAQNDSKAVSFEHLNFGFVSDLDIRIYVLNSLSSLRMACVGRW